MPPPPAPKAAEAANAAAPCETHAATSSAEQLHTTAEPVDMVAEVARRYLRETSQQRCALNCQNSFDRVSVTLTMSDLLDCRASEHLRLSWNWKRAKPLCACHRPSICCTTHVLQQPPLHCILFSELTSRHEVPCNCTTSCMCRRQAALLRARQASVRRDGSTSASPSPAPSLLPLPASLNGTAAAQGATSLPPAQQAKSDAQLAPQVAQHAQRDGQMSLGGLAPLLTVSSVSKALKHSHGRDGPGLAHAGSGISTTRSLYNELFLARFLSTQGSDLASVGSSLPVATSLHTQRSLLRVMSRSQSNALARAQSNAAAAAAANVATGAASNAQRANVASDTQSSLPTIQEENAALQRLRKGASTAADAIRHDRAGARNTAVHRQQPASQQTAAAGASNTFVPATAAARTASGAAARTGSGVAAQGRQRTKRAAAARGLPAAGDVPADAAAGTRSPAGTTSLSPVRSDSTVATGPPKRGAQGITGHARRQRSADSDDTKSASSQHVATTTVQGRRRQRSVDSRDAKSTVTQHQDAGAAVDATVATANATASETKQPRAARRAAPAQAAQAGRLAQAGSSASQLSPAERRQIGVIADIRPEQSQVAEGSADAAMPASTQPDTATVSDEAATQKAAKPVARDRTKASAASSSARRTGQKKQKAAAHSGANALDAGTGSAMQGAQVAADIAEAQHLAAQQAASGTEPSAGPGQSQSVANTGADASAVDAAQSASAAEHATDASQAALDSQQSEVASTGSVTVGNAGHEVHAKASLDADVHQAKRAGQNLASDSKATKQKSQATSQKRKLGTRAPRAAAGMQPGDIGAEPSEVLQHAGENSIHHGAIASSDLATAHSPIVAGRHTGAKSADAAGQPEAEQVAAADANMPRVKQASKQAHAEEQQQSKGGNEGVGFAKPDAAAPVERGHATNHSTHIEQEVQGAPLFYVPS